MHDYVIGLDGGGTKTDGVLVGQDGRVLARRCVGASNPNDVGEEASAAVVRALAEVLATEAGVHLADCFVFGGISGALNHREGLTARLRSAVPAPGGVEIDSDMVNLLSAELPDRDGACIICGTGSACFVRRGQEVFRIGGWGYLLDSAGSGYDIGRQALEAALRAQDGRGCPTALSAKLADALGAPVQDSLTRLYARCPLRYLRRHVKAMRSHAPYWIGTRRRSLNCCAPHGTGCVRGCRRTPARPECPYFWTAASAVTIIPRGAMPSPAIYRLMCRQPCRWQAVRSSGGRRQRQCAATAGRRIQSDTQDPFSWQTPIFPDERLTTIMNEIDTSVQSRLTRLSVRRTLLFVLLTQVLYTVLYAFVLNPLYTHFASDVLYKDAWWLDLIGVAIDATDVILFILVYPASLYALWCGGWRQGYRVPVLFSVLTLFKFAVNYAVGVFIEYGGVPSGDFLADDLPLVIPLALLELLQYGIVLGLATLWYHVYRVRQADAAALAALRQKPYESPAVLPLTRLFDMGNPMQRALFDAGLTVAILGILRHVIYQLTLFAANGRMDAPLQIAVDLVGDLLVGAALYLVGILLVNRFARRDSRV